MAYQKGWYDSKEFIMAVTTSRTKRRKVGNNCQNLEEKQQLPVMECNQTSVTL